MDEYTDFFSEDNGSTGANTPSPNEESRYSVPPRLGLLAQLNDEEFNIVARAAQLKFVPAGTVIFEQSSEADRFFILVEGQVEVARDGEVLATLGPGSFFGESALLVGGRRSASVSASIDAAIWSVDYEAFQNVVSGHLMEDNTARETIHARLANTPPESFR